MFITHKNLILSNLQNKTEPNCGFQRNGFIKTKTEPKFKNPFRTSLIVCDVIGCTQQPEPFVSQLQGHLLNEFLAWVALCKIRTERMS